MTMQRSRLVFPLLVLSLLAALLVAPAVAAQPAGHSGILHTFLTGAEEPLGGDPNGFGLSVIHVNAATGQICYLAIGVGIAPATAAHIHVAPVGESGPPVLPLEQLNAHVFRGCATDMALAEALLADPANYYVNIHNAEYPDGAIRGQLD